MKLKVVGSGSQGNMYILTAKDNFRLVIDMGFSFSRIKRELNFDLSNVHFIVSHEQHGDHGKGVSEAIKKGCNVHYGMPHDEMLVIQDFYILPFEVKHNVPTQGFYIHHHEMGNLLFLTDSGYINHSFPDVNHWLIEANHDSDYIIDSVIDHGSNAYLGQRVLDDHLSIQNCKKVLRNQDLSMCQSITLIHLSDRNSDEKRFKKEITAMTGINCEVARPGLEIDLSLDPWKL